MVKEPQVNLPDAPRTGLPTLEDTGNFAEAEPVMVDTDTAKASQRPNRANRLSQPDPRELLYRAESSLYSLSDLLLYYLLECDIRKRLAAFVSHCHVIYVVWEQREEMQMPFTGRTTVRVLSLGCFAQ